VDQNLDHWENSGHRERCQQETRHRAVDCPNLQWHQHRTDSWAVKNRHRLVFCLKLSNFYVEDI
jgi:hypothetical protein